ncbi:BapA/Bap/LapF family large adhesin [Buttiauxella sp. S04-F03]|uniref:BapA/Bap/LapF family large adhesin n=1 Tax=Buttiauxella sp. S04-F03 TaxID=2904525 RepID=UPI001E65113B|nr:BapA/Bap/LapF family large adhesin [Buttiauxella sp. S04-F03]MCE0813785.1 Ig-like domain-containing protein [Buttiauxella sp. S04-F03]
MRSISIISKLTGVTNNVEASEITLTAPSIVELKAERSDIASIARTNQDMVITLRDGEVITVKNFYAYADQGGNQLVLEDSHGALWWVQDTDSAFHFEHINSIDDLMVATGAENHGGAAIWPWVLGGVAIAGGIALAAGGGGGGGDSDNDGETGGPNPPPPPSTDTTPPAAPTNLNVSADGKTITGKAEPGSTVTITDPSGQIIGKGTAGSDGTFTIPLKNPQISGEDLTAHATDPSGNTGPDATVIAPNIPLPDAPTLTNVVDDVAPVLSNVPKTQSTNDNTPTLQGTGKAWTTVHIYDGDKEIGTAVVDASGNWSYTPTTALSDGSHSFSVTATNAKGESTHSPSYTITIDTVAPESPDVDQLQDDVGSIKGSIVSGTYTDETAPIIHGTGEAGDKVTIFDNGVQIAQITVGSDGKWSFTPTKPLADGNHTVTLIQTDPAGNVSKTTTSPTFIVDHTPPDAAKITNVSEDGTKVTGTAEPGTTVTITGANNVVLGTSVVGANGSFTITLTPAQTHGETLTANIHDRAGNVGPDTNFDASNSHFPTVPVLVTVADDAGTITGNLTNGQATDDKTPTLSGTAEAGTKVTIYDKGVAIGSTTADGTGHWAFTPAALPDGQHVFTLTATNSSGTSGTSSGFTVAIDTAAPTAPTDLVVSDDGSHVTGSAEAGSTVTITDSNGAPIGSATTGADGKFNVTITPPQVNGETLEATATDPAGNSSGQSSVTAPDHTAPSIPIITELLDDVGTITGPIANNGVTNDTRPMLTGTGESGDTITIFDKGVQIGQVAVGNDGKWSFTPGTPLTESEHALTVQQSDAAGNKSPLVTGPTFTVDLTPPTAAVIDSVSQNGTTVTGHAESGSTIAIFDASNTLLGTALVGTDGTFTVNISPAQTHGESLSAHIQDAAGNAGPDTPFTASNSQFPTVPELDTVTDDAGTIAGTLNNGQSTDDKTPTLSGLAEIGSTVTIYDNGILSGTATVNGTGHWNYTPPAILDGQHVFTLTATNSSGTSGVSSAFTVVVDTLAPLAPNGMDVSADGTIVTGSAEAGSTVTITDSNGDPIGSATAGTDGKFSVTIDPPQLNGETLGATATDAAGNQSPNATVIAEDHTAPLAPTNLLVSADGEHVTGNAEPGSTVTVKDSKGMVLGTGTADVNGDFDVTPLMPAQLNGQPLLVTATDAAHNTSPSATVVAQDHTAPDAPTNLHVNEEGTVVTGSAEPGSTVKVTDANNVELGTGTAGGDGTFTVSITPPQTNGEILGVSATDNAGNLGPKAPVDAPDTTAPLVPVITHVIDDFANHTGDLTSGQTTNDSKPELQGTAEEGTTVKIYDNGLLLGSTTAGAGGVWSFIPTTVLSQGSHNLTVTATDAGNNTSPAASFNVVVDTIAPQAPTITLVNDDVGTITGPVLNNGSTNDQTPTITGTGEPGSILTLLDGTQPLITLTVDSSGTWSYTPTLLPVGSHTFTVVAEDAAGNVTSPSAGFTINVDITPPATPVINSVQDNIGTVKGELAQDNATDDTRPQVSGTGDVGSTITLYDGTTPVGSATIGTDGKWSITPTQPLSEGPHTLNAIATDAAGNASPAASYNLTVDTTAPGAPLIISAQGEIANQSAPLVNGGSTQNGTPTLTGSGEPGATINIYDNGGTTPIGTVTVPAGGTWTFTPSPALSETSHTLTAVATDPAGNVGLPSAGFTLTVDSTVPATPGIPVVTDDQAPVLGNISNGGSTNDTTPTISGTGSVGDTITIRDNGSDIGTTTVRADGSWSFTPQTPISGQNHSISVIESDAAGNKSLPSGSVAFTLDTAASAAPTIVSADDNVGPVQASLSTGGVTDDNTPTFHGTGVDGDTITLYSGSTVIGTTTVSGGTWTITTTTLQDGQQKITATATDAAGNISLSSADFTLTVYTTPLTAPVVTEVVDNVGTIQTPLVNGSYTDDTTPTFKGTGTAGSTVSIYDNGGTTAIGTAIVGTDGTWTITPTTALPTGVSDHTFTFSATDAVGNTVASTNPILLHIDTVAPLAPTVLVPGDTVVSGTAEAGSTVIIRNSTTELGRGIADADGKWAITLSPAQLPGTALVAIAQDVAGNQSPSANFNATLSLALQPPTIDHVVDNVGTVSGDIANGKTTDDTTPTLSGSNAASLATVHIFVDGTEVATVIADPLGAWSYQIPAALAQGSHTFAVSQTFAAQTSNLSPAFTVIVDTAAPTIPVITTVTDDVAPITGTVNSGQATNDPRPTITGTGEVGSTITILDNGTPIGTAVVGTGGTWTFTPTTDLDQGLHPITITSTDAAGNVSAPSAGFSVNVDTLTTAPVISSVTDNVGTPAPVISGVPTNDNTPTFTGTAEPNSTITISENGKVIGTALVDSTGNWNFTPNPALTDGSHNLTIITTDAAGNVSTATTFNAVIDTASPVVPAITLVVDDQTQVGVDNPLTNGQLTKDTQPAISGTSEANAIITIKDGTTVLGTTTASPTGDWSFTPDSGHALGQGSHNLTVTATDAAGNISNPSSVFTVVVDSVAPTAPLIVTVTDNTAPNIGPITSGQPTNETRPAITGSGEVGSTIKIYDGSNPTPLGTATVGSGGTWSFTPPTALSSGSHNLTVTATDAAGNVSAPSAIFNVVVDLAAPGTPAITNIADDVGTEKGDLTNGQSTDDTLPLISGTAEAGTTITIYDNGSIIGTVNASATDGTWNFTPPVGSPLTNGNHAFTVTATDSAGNVSSLSNTFNIVVDTAAPTAPIVIQAFDDVGPVTGALVNGQSTNDNTPLLSGTAEANSIVSISDNGVFLATVTASPTGTWSYTPPARLDGEHVFTATSTDAAGNIGAVSGSFTLTIDTSTPVTPALSTVYDDVAGGAFNANLTNGQVTNDARPTISGTGEVGTTITILDGGTPIGTVTVPAGGNWTFTPTTPLAAGLHTFTITATDAAGNVSTASAGFAITVDTTPPTTPVITSIVDDVAAGVFNNPLANNQATNDSRPTLNGTAEAGSTVAIYDKGVFVTNVTASGTGAWAYTPTQPLSEGSHSFTVTATDLAGNTSALSQSSSIVVDTTAPGAPTGLAVNATGTTVTGTAEAGSTVTITTSGGTVLGTATADGTGSFSVAITPAQTNSQALLAFAQDVAGNVGTSAGFTAPNTALPGVPVITSILDDAAPVTGTVANGQSTNDATPTINGTADIGATVNIYNNGVLMGSTVATNGTWSYIPSALTEGSHNFTATATNVNGTGSPSAQVTVIVDTIAPLAPTATVSVDGNTISGTAEPNSTVTVTLADGVTTITATTNGSGAWTAPLTTRQIDGEILSIKATDAAGNVSPVITATAPDLPLAANDNVIDLALSSTATVSPPVHYNDYGVLLVGALGNSVQVLGSDTAQVQFNVGAGTGNITIEAAATGIVLTLLNSLEVAVQRFDSGTGTWTTVYDSSQAQFANLLTIGASGITFKIDNLPEGTYRVLSYNTNLLATGSLTSLDVAVEQVGPGVVTGETSHQGNVITDIDPSGGQDTAPAGTVVTSVTNAQGQVLAVGASGADINGLYGTLHINQNGSYTYTLNNTTAAVLGHTENFNYTISQNGISDTAQLVVTLGNGAPASSVTATDNTAALTYSTDVEAVNHGASQQSGFSVVSVGLGNVLNADVLANMANPIIFDVDDGSTRTMTLQASVGGVALLSTFDLYIYKFNDVTQQFEQYQVQKTWLTAPLLGGTSGQLTLTLPGGEYLFLLNNASGVSVLTGYTLNILQDHTYAVESLSATTNGNVMQDDISPVGSHITQVNGVSIAATGTTTINGEYGVLTIDANGNYTYKLNAGVGADSIKTPDSFVYTVTAPNGDTDTASLNVTATPTPVNAIDDISTAMLINTAQTTASYSDTTVGSASWQAKLLASSSGSGSGTFVVGTNDVLHNPALHFTVQSVLSLGGLNVDWNITNSAGTVIRSGTISGGLLLGGVADINLAGLDLQAGTYTLNYTGSMGALAAGQVTITPTVTGTTIDLDNYLTQGVSTVHGNLYDGTDSSGAIDQLGTVHTLLSITGFNGTTTTLNPLTNSSATATIQGHYGTLQIGIDGAYTYTLNNGINPASITTKETFTYTLNDQNGHSDSATLTINMNPQFVSTAQSDVITGSAYGDTLVYHLLNSANSTGGNGADTWKDFHMADGDKINIHDLLTGWNPATSNIANYLSVSYNGTSTVISIDRDGTGATHNPTQLVTLESTHVTLDELVQQNHIIT